MHNHVRMSLTASNIMHLYHFAFVNIFVVFVRYRSIGAVDMNFLSVKTRFKTRHWPKMIKISMAFQIVPMCWKILELSKRLHLLIAV